MEMLYGKPRKLSKAETIKHFGKETYEEIESINKKIQEFQKSRDEINKLPTLFQLVLRSRRRIRDLIKGLKDLSVESGIEFKSWQVPFHFRIFLSFKEDSKYKQTRNNLRSALKGCPRKTEIGYMFFEQRYTQKVYSNPIIQNFFEFSLLYSSTKHIQLSAKKAERLFLRACKVSFGVPLKKESETQSFKDFLAFINGEKGYFDSTNLPTYEAGRNKAATEEMKEYFRQGMSHRKISIEMNPEIRGAARTKDAARIGKALRRCGLYVRSRKKLS